MQLSDAIKHRINELMKFNNIYTIHELTLLAGIPYSSVNDFFQGRTALLRLDKLVLISEAMNIDLCEFFNSPIFKNIEIDD